MVEVVVGSGDQAKTFHAHKNLLTQHSDFFEAALNRDWKESSDRKVSLPDDEADQFAQFHDFLYTGALFVIHEGDEYTCDDGHLWDHEYIRICDASVLGSKLQSTVFMDVATDSLIAKCLSEDSWPTGLYGVVIDHVARSAGIRKLLIDIAVHEWSEGSFAEMEGHVANKDFLHDLMMALVKVRVEGRDKARPWVDAGCRYHDHGEEKPCYRKIFKY